MASTMFADQETKKMPLSGRRPSRTRGLTSIEAGIRTRTATRRAAEHRCFQRFLQDVLWDVNAGQRTRTAIWTASITRIEALLDKVDDPVLANLWRQICPLDVEQLPDRQGLIADLADFAEVLQPRLNGMQAPQLCRLIEAYATKHHRSQRFVRDLLWDVNARRSRVVADVQPPVRLEHGIIDVGSVAVGV